MGWWLKAWTTFYVIDETFLPRRPLLRACADGRAAGAKRCLLRTEDLTALLIDARRASTADRLGLGTPCFDIALQFQPRAVVDHPIRREKRASVTVRPPQTGQSSAYRSPQPV
jgi:hypothetical protein